MAVTMSIEECLAHIPVTLTPEMERYATDEVFLHSRYIFTTRAGKRQFGYCTHCGQTFRTEGLRHNNKATCPECGSACIVKSSGKGHKYLFDEAYFTYYMKSAIDPQVIVAIGTYAIRNFTGDYVGVKTRYAATSLYVFQPGIGGTAFNRWAYFSQADTFQTGKFQRAGSVACQFGRGHYAGILTTYSRKSLAAAVADTPFRYSTWEQYNDVGDLTGFFDLCSRYACVEYLTKLGFRHLVTGKLIGERTYSAVNWRGSNPLKVLKLSKQDLREIKQQGMMLTFPVLRLLQAGRKDGSNLAPLEAVHLSATYHGSWEAEVDDLLQLRKYGSIRRITNYLAKQSGNEGCHLARPPYGKPTEAMRAWRDYIADCTKLGLDLSQERVLFPSNLYQAHQNTIKQIKLKADRLIRQKIKKQAAKLAKYRFQQDGLLIRPAVSQDELIAEGKALHHCVGTYADRYAAGTTAIYCIRKVDEPDTPFFTVEVIREQVTQCRGLKNCLPDDRVKAFVGQFTAAKLQTSARHRGIERQEVAL